MSKIQESLPGGEGWIAGVGRGSSVSNNDERGSPETQNRLQRASASVFHQVKNGRHVK
jgi:hypothetical protein